MFRRFGGVVALAVALCLFELAWILIGLVHVWSHPMIGWIAPVVLPVLTVRQQFRVSRCAQLPPATRRFWRHVGVASVVLVVAMISNAYDALGGPELVQQQGPLTLGLLVDPPVDRANPRHTVRDVFITADRDDDRGIYVSGAKMVATGSALTSAPIVQWIVTATA